MAVYGSIWQYMAFEWFGVVWGLMGLDWLGFRDI
jgi:hypothetical protein